MPAAIFVPTVASPIKIANIRSCGAKLVIEGDRYADALAASRSWSAKSGALELHAYDSVETLLGQGTLGLELHQQAPELDTLLVAVGGGGLIGGVAAYYSELIAQGRVRIIGVEPELAPTLTYALRSGHPIDSPAGGIAADSLAPKRVGELMFPIAQRSVNRVILVSDDDIRQAQQILWDSVRLVVEPGGAAAFAVLTSGKYVPAYAERIAVILCGGNTNAVNLLQSLGIDLSVPAAPVASFVPVVRTGNLVFLSGHIAKQAGKPLAGKLGADLTTEQGQAAARSVAIELLGTLNAALDLNTVKQIVKLMVLVNSAPAFTEQHLVANGASDFLCQVFGEAGKHARSAFGVAQIPFGSCVEIELIAEV